VRWCGVVVWCGVVWCGVVWSEPPEAPGFAVWLSVCRGFQNYE
jgi:hypothetical protein